jgi:hypothetical protein
MLESVKPLNKEDFDPLSLVAPIDEHTRDISNLSARVKTLEDKFGTHTQIANTLLETSNEAVKMSEMLESSFLKLIGKNEPIRNAVKELVRTEDRIFIANQMRRWGWLLAAAFLFLITQISAEAVKVIYHFYFPGR